MPDRGTGAERLARQAVTWVVVQGDVAPGPSLYQGDAGILLALLEVDAHDPATAQDDGAEAMAFPRPGLSPAGSQDSPHRRPGETMM